MFCKHKWSKITEETMKSAYEQLKEGEQLTKGNLWVFSKKYICILQC